MQATVFETVGSASDARPTCWLLVSGHKGHCMLVIHNSFVVYLTLLAGPC